jgi:hypothetical protein
MDVEQLIDYLLDGLPYEPQEEVNDTINERQNEVESESLPPNYVFLSYSRQDKELMKRMLYSLEESGITVVCDAHLRAGPAWTKSIKKAVQNANCMIVLVTSNAGDSSGIDNEIAEMISVGKKSSIIPVLVGDGENRHIPHQINTNNRIDLREGNQSDLLEQSMQLIASIKACGT